MFNKYIFILLLGVGLFANENAFAAKHKTVKHSTHTSSKHKSIHKKGSKLVAKKGKRKSRGHYDNSNEMTVAIDANGQKQLSNPRQIIAINNEKARVTDSIRKVSVQNTEKDEKEGYFASMFASKNKNASFQTIEGTAAVFKSISGWEDKKFYVLTNLLPIGTIVRITTPDLKSICAKVINALPEVGNSVQLRLNDAAAAILGINNKTFPVSVTY